MKYLTYVTHLYCEVLRRIKIAGRTAVISNIGKPLKQLLDRIRCIQFFAAKNTKEESDFRVAIFSEIHLFGYEVLPN